MNRRFLVRCPTRDAWIHAFLLAGAVAMMAFIVMSPDVMQLIA